MLPLTLAEIAAAAGGTLHDGDPATVVTAKITFDSRAVEGGGMYVALPGARVDGHDFVDAAIEAGAVAVVTTRAVGVPAVVVEDTLLAYGKIASALVGRLPRLRVAAVTGSVGKTTTKDLMGQVLGRLGPTLAPPGNRNSEAGLPETVSLLTPEHRFLVAEMGARNVGDIAYMAGIVHPAVGVVLNVGVSHLGTFGSREGIAQAKGELVESLEADGVAVLNADDELVAAMASRTKARVVTFGLGAAADVRAEGITVDDEGRASFTLHTPGGSAPVSLRLRGEHLVPNALAAAAVALAFTDDVALVAGALSEAEPVSAGRMRVAEGRDGVTVINDAYNSSPTAATGALRTMATMARGRRTVAVLGSMYELGGDSAAEHASVGRVVAEVGIDLLLTVGNEDAVALGEAAAAGGVETRHVADADAAREALAGLLKPGDLVLVKASNGVGLMRVADGLL
jgi:UDP-N-acetylmuramoyl-tripeptide--D-alanyl-D-alanine ligase